MPANTIVNDLTITDFKSPKPPETAKITVFDVIVEIFSHTCIEIFVIFALNLLKQELILPFSLVKYPFISLPSMCTLVKFLSPVNAALCCCYIIIAKRIFAIFSHTGSRSKVQPITLNGGAKFGKFNDAFSSKRKQQFFWREIIPMPMGKGKGTVVQANEFSDSNNMEEEGSEDLIQKNSDFMDMNTTFFDRPFIFGSL